MSNMSYCRFENTVSAMRDCLNAVQDAVNDGTGINAFRKELSSDYERRAFDQFYGLCEEFMQAHCELEDIYEEDEMVE